MAGGQAEGQAVERRQEEGERAAGPAAVWQEEGEREEGVADAPGPQAQMRSLQTPEEHTPIRVRGRLHQSLEVVVLPGPVWERLWAWASVAA